MSIQHPMTKQGKFAVPPNPFNKAPGPQASSEQPLSDEEVFEMQMQKMETSMSNVGGLAPESDTVLEADKKKSQIVEKLMFYKKPVYKEVSLGDTVFKLKALTQYENEKVLKAISTLPGEQQLIKASQMSLAASIESVDGVPLEELYTGDAKIESPLLKKYAILNEWNQYVVSSILDAYRLFKDELSKSVTFDFLDKKLGSQSTE